MSVGTQKILDSIKHISPSAAFFCAAPSSVDEANEQIAMSKRKALVAQEQRAHVAELDLAEDFEDLEKGLEEPDPVLGWNPRASQEPGKTPPMAL